MPGANKKKFNASAASPQPAKAAASLPSWGNAYTQQKNSMIFVPWDEASENMRKRHLEESLHRHIVVQKPFKVGPPLKFKKQK